MRVSKRRTEDMPLYVSVPNKPFGDRMDVVYDQVDVLDLSGELNYRKSEQLSLTARLDVYSYTTKVQQEAWNLPPYALSFMARYDMRSKLILKAEAQFLGKRPAYRVAGPLENGEIVDPVQQVDLDGFLDLYLGIEYRYNKRLSLFMDLSNLSASKYERWYKHPVQRSLLMGGATYAF